MGHGRGETKRRIHSLSDDSGKEEITLKCFYSIYRLYVFRVWKKIVPIFHVIHFNEHLFLHSSINLSDKNQE